MQKLNLKRLGMAIPCFYQYETVAKVNDHVFTLVKVKDRTLDFHVHLDSDEVFYIVSGDMILEFRHEKVHLHTGDMFVVPKGVEHRPVCTDEVICLLIEKSGTLNNNNTGGTYSSSNI